MTNEKDGPPSEYLRGKARGLRLAMEVIDEIHRTGRYTDGTDAERGVTAVGLKRALEIIEETCAPGRFPPVGSIDITEHHWYKGWRNCEEAIKAAIAREMEKR